MIRIQWSTRLETVLGEFNETLRRTGFPGELAIESRRASWGGTEYQIWLKTFDGGAGPIGGWYTASAALAYLEGFQGAFTTLQGDPWKP